MIKAREGMLQYEHFFTILAEQLALAQRIAQSPITPTHAYHCSQTQYALIHTCLYQPATGTWVSHDTTCSQVLSITTPIRPISRPPLPSSIPTIVLIILAYAAAGRSPYSSRSSYRFHSYYIHCSDRSFAAAAAPAAGLHVYKEICDRP